jgi:WD40 repeat protein
MNAILLGLGLLSFVLPDAGLQQGAPPDDGTLARTIRFKGRQVRSMGCSKDLSMLAIGDNLGTVHLYDINKAKIAFSFLVAPENQEFGRIEAVAFSESGAMIATGSSDGCVSVWETITGRRRMQLKGLGGRVLALAFSPNGQTLASGGTDKDISIWDIRDGKLVGTLLGHDDVVMAVSFLSDGEKLLSGSLDGSLKVWSLKQKKAIWSTNAHEGGVLAAMYAPRGGRFVSCGLDDRVRLWTWNNECAKSVHSERLIACQCVGFSQDSEHIFVGTGKGIIKVWKASDVEWSCELRHGGVVAGLAVIGSELLASGGWDGVVKLWRVRQVISDSQKRRDMEKKSEGK